MSDPYRTPAFGLSNKIYRVMWWVCYIALFRWSPKPFFGWRNFLLKVFGAQIGEKCAIYPSVRIWSPANLICEDMVAIADRVEIYNPGGVYLSSHAIISQGAYLCGATHDYNSRNFELISKPIKIGRYSWVCSRSVVSPGVVIGDYAILGTMSLATKNLAPYGIYGGVPAEYIKEREAAK